MKITISKLLLIAVTAFAPGTAFAQITSYQPVYTPNTRPIDMRNNGNAPESMLPDRDTPQSITIYSNTLLFASCAEKQNPGLVGKALASVPNTSTENMLLGRMRSLLESCNPQSAVGILTLTRGALSEAKYKEMVSGDVDAQKITATGADSQAFLDFEQKRNSKRLDNDQKIIDVTNCLAAVQPGIANKLLLTSHGSAEETAALAELFAKAPSCAGEKRPKISSAFLRAFIADSMYQLATSEWGAKFMPWTRRAGQ